MQKKQIQDVEDDYENVVRHKCENLAFHDHDQRMFQGMLMCMSRKPAVRLRMRRGDGAYARHSHKRMRVSRPSILHAEDGAL